MTRSNSVLRDKLTRGETIDLRGHAKAGGGIVLVMQAFSRMLLDEGGYDVQDWPLFSSARKGANVCAYMRIGVGTVEAANQVAQPDVVIVVNEAVAPEIDFAQGTREGVFVVNTRSTPEEIAARYRLGGTVVTVPGDDLAMEYLNRPIASVAVLAALARATGLVDGAHAHASVGATLKKRRLPQRIIDANLSLFTAAMERLRFAEIPGTPETVHAAPVFRGYGTLPTGAQMALRTSAHHYTNGYGRPGFRVRFADDAGRCNGCALCVVNCPDGIIEFSPDPARGPIVHGAQFDTFCKVCRECVAACPLDLFHEELDANAAS